MVRRMKRIVVLLVICGAPAGCWASGPRMLDGQVKQAGNLPCFTVADTSEARKSPPEIVALDVYALGPNEEANMVWSLDMTKKQSPVRLSPDNCIAYGADGLMPQSAKSLEVGARYAVSINSSIRKGDESENRSYQSYFCLTKGENQALTVHQVLWNEKNKAWNWGVCEAN